MFSFLCPRVLLVIASLILKIDLEQIFFNHPNSSAEIEFFKDPKFEF